MYFPSPNVTNVTGFIAYANNVTAVGYGTISPFPVLGLVGEIALFIIIFMGLRNFNYPTTHAFAAGSFSIMTVSIILFVLGLLPAIGVIVPILMLIASIFIIKERS